MYKSFERRGGLKIGKGFTTGFGVERRSAVESQGFFRSVRVGAFGVGNDVLVVE